MVMSLEKLNTFIIKENDWTVRLLNSSMPFPKKYIFALVWFDGNTSLWTTVLFDQYRDPLFEDSSDIFLEAKQQLFKKLEEYSSKGYKITTVTSGYYIPGMYVRKRR